jgi:uncharacterized protein YidB (DUF937 family)
MGLVDEIAGRIADRARTTGTAGGLRSGSNMRGVLLALAPIALAMLGRRGREGDHAREGTAAREHAAARQPNVGGLAGKVLGRLLEGSSGPFAALIERFQRAGYGEQTRSWIASGENQPLPPEAVERALGRENVSELAREAGLSESDVSRGLAELLPEMVDRVTPRGEVPDEAALRTNVDDLARRFEAR